MSPIIPFLKAIPVAAKSPYALVAYCISALLFIVLIYKRTQIKPVLRQLKDLPQTDRIKAIETALGVKLPARISAEQWLRNQRLQYGFLAFVALLVSMVTVIVVALNRKEPVLAVPYNMPPKKVFVKVELWPSPKIATSFLKKNDARLYLKNGGSELTLTQFVASPDFLEAKQEIDPTLIGQPVDVTITPRTKYRIEQNRRYLTELLRIEVFPLGKRPPIQVAVAPSGDKVIKTTDLPVSTMAVAFANAKDPSKVELSPKTSYILDLYGTKLNLGSKIAVVDANNTPIYGAWAGNELGVPNGMPIQVNADGKALKVYFGVPETAAGKSLFLALRDPNGETKRYPAGFVTTSFAIPKVAH